MTVINNGRNSMPSTPYTVFPCEKIAKKVSKVTSYSWEELYYPARILLKICNNDEKAAESELLIICDYATSQIISPASAAKEINHIIKLMEI